MIDIFCQESCGLSRNVLFFFIFFVIVKGPLCKKSLFLSPNLAKAGLTILLMMVFLV